MEGGANLGERGQSKVVSQMTSEDGVDILFVDAGSIQESSGIIFAFWDIRGPVISCGGEGGFGTHEITCPFPFKNVFQCPQYPPRRRHTLYPTTEA